MTKAEFKQLVATLKQTIKDTKVKKKDRARITVDEFERIQEVLDELLLAKVIITDEDDNEVVYFGSY